MSFDLRFCCGGYRKKLEPWSPSVKSGLRKLVNEEPRRSPSCASPPRSKRFLTAQDVADLVQRYEGGETIQQIGNHYGISKTRVATVLREQGATIRRQGLNDGQVSEAATLYSSGRSLACLAARYSVSHTTIAASFRRQEIRLRPRPGWT
jgi:hypothetical protein